MISFLIARKPFVGLIDSFYSLLEKLWPIFNSFCSILETWEVYI